MGTVRTSIAALGLAVITACGPTSSAVEPLAKAEGWRDTVARAEAPPYGLVEVAYDADTARQAWDDNVPDGLVQGNSREGEPGVYASLDDVDFSRQVLVVWHSGESGTCPGWLADIDTDDDGSVTIDRGEFVPDDGCTDDYNPYRMVLAVDRGRLPAPERLPTENVRMGVITDGRVSAYPDRATTDLPDES